MLLIYGDAAIIYAETLVHSTLEHCDDADFTFTVFFNMKEHMVYVKQRPYLHTFLERVAEMFEVVIFTASQSIYAEQLLDILDPYRKFISRRVYRESCIFTDGSYTKDLTVLGVDLAKVAIIDNTPQVYPLAICPFLNFCFFVLQCVVAFPLYGLFYLLKNLPHSGSCLNRYHLCVGRLQNQLYMSIKIEVFVWAHCLMWN